MHLLNFIFLGEGVITTTTTLAPHEASHHSHHIHCRDRIWSIPHLLGYLGTSVRAFHFCSLFQFLLSIAILAGVTISTSQVCKPFWSLPWHASECWFLEVFYLEEFLFIFHFLSSSFWLLLLSFFIFKQHCVSSFPFIHLKLKLKLQDFTSSEHTSYPVGGPKWSEVK